MKLINADELEPDTEWSDYYDGFISYSQSQIDSMEEVKAIPLDEVKQAREEMENEVFDSLDDDGSDWFTADKVSECMAILDRLIMEETESEE